MSTFPSWEDYDKDFESEKEAQRFVFNNVQDYLPDYLFVCSKTDLKDIKLNIDDVL